MNAIIKKTLNVTFNVLGWFFLLMAIWLMWDALNSDMNAIQEYTAVTAFGVLAIAFFMKSK